jgi:hypothetical protein
MIWYTYPKFFYCFLVLEVFFTIEFATFWKLKIFKKMKIHGRDPAT